MLASTPMFRALFLVLAVAAAPALAQDDDLAPLPTKPKPKPAAPRQRPKAQPKKPAPAPVANDDDLAPLPAQKGDLLVKLTGLVKGAKLFIDDREIGTLPQPAQSVAIGEHSVSVRRLGYATLNKRVNVTANKTVDVNVSLEAVSAVLSVSSDVAGAQVFVNGRLVGTTPLYDVEVPPGSFEIAVKKDGYRDGSQVLSAKAGKDYPIEVKLGAPISAGAVATTSDAPLNNDLAPPLVGNDSSLTTTTTVDNSPVYQRWWFWTAAVAVVAGVVVTGVVVASNTGPAPSVHQKDFCMAKCDGWINQPAAIVPLR
jgi:hypothetical protein